MEVRLLKMITVKKHGTQIARLILSLAAITLGAYLMAFGSHPATGIPFFLASTFLSLRKKDLTKELPKKQAMWSIGLVAVLVAIIVIIALSGDAKESNEWFLEWSYRPHFIVTIWILMVVGCFRASRVPVTTPDE
jgi:hypothetical protein